MTNVLVYGMMGTNQGGIETFLLKMNAEVGPELAFEYVIDTAECMHTQAIEALGGSVTYIASRRHRPLQNLRDSLRLLRARREDVRTVYFNLSSLSWIPPVLIALALGYRVVIHSHNSRYVKANSGALYLAINNLSRFVLGRCRLVRLTCSAPAAAFLFGRREDVAMVYNAIDAEKFRFSQAVRDRMRQENGLEDSFVLGFVGRLADQKNPLFLCDILARVAEEIPKARLMVLGDGSMRKALEARIDELSLGGRITLLGNQPNVNDWMWAMDVLLLPSLHEGLPYVLVEAQASGLPCLTSESVTREAAATPLVEYLPLGDAAVWAARVCALYEARAALDRDRWFQTIMDSPFNIRNESKKLARILKGEQP